MNETEQQDLTLLSELCSDKQLEGVTNFLEVLIENKLFSEVILITNKSLGTTLKEMIQNYFI